MDAAHFLVSGRVQGVGFRAATRRRAQELGLSGFARNLADGRVEAFAQGDPLALDAFALWLQQGPSLARVDAVQRKPTAPEHATSGFSYG